MIGLIVCCVGVVRFILAMIMKLTFIAKNAEVRLEDLMTSMEIYKIIQTISTENIIREIKKRLDDNTLSIVETQLLNDLLGRYVEDQ